jgi:hypothetical protein
LEKGLWEESRQNLFMESNNGLMKLAIEEAGKGQSEGEFSDARFSERTFDFPNIENLKL